MRILARVILSVFTYLLSLPTTPAVSPAQFRIPHPSCLVSPHSLPWRLVLGGWGWGPCPRLCVASQTLPLPCDFSRHADFSIAGMEVEGAQ